MVEQLVKPRQDDPPGPAGLDLQNVSRLKVGTTERRKRNRYLMLAGNSSSILYLPHSGKDYCAR